MDATTQNMQDFFAPQGPIARQLSGFELRAEQVEMACAVERVLQERGRLLVEAGTGVGKSFAYLLPAIHRAVTHHERIVIATNTISLQEQLIEKDIPLLRAALPDEFTAVLVKGRGNYLSLRRLQLASSRQQTLFIDPQQLADLHVIEDWAYETTDGSLATLPQITRMDIWDRVQSDADNCMGRRCPNYRKCFFQTARRRMESANILVCNHALFFSDLALKAQGVGFLPRYDHVILDEAHNIEDAACDHFGLSLSEGRVIHLLNTLYNDHTSRSQTRPRGFLANVTLNDDVQGSNADQAVGHAIDAVHSCRDANRLFFDRLLAWRTMNQENRQSYSRGGDRGGGGGAPGSPTLRINDPSVIEDSLAPAARELSLRLKRLKEIAKREEDQFELNAYAQRASSIADECSTLIRQQLEGCVYWVEVNEHAHASASSSSSSPGGRRRSSSSRGGGGGAGFRRVTLACSPVEVGPILRRQLFSKQHTVILTSATMTTGRGNFSHLMERLGCDRRIEIAHPASAEGSADIPAGSPSPESFDGSEIDLVYEPESDTPASPPAPHTPSPGSRFVETRTLELGSPFDYQRQVEFFVDDDLPEPGESTYVAQVTPRIIEHVKATDGGTFVLFTSFSMLRRVAECFREVMHDHGLDYPMIVHGEDGPRGLLLNRFLAGGNSVLFGTASFWQGVDVRGSALRNVIITRLPFDVPDVPVIQARLERIKERGGNPFMDDSLPRAVIRFKQGFGRLIRSSTDTGRFVVLDPRIISKRYGRAFLDILPEGMPARMRRSGARP